MVIETNVCFALLADENDESAGAVLYYSRLYVCQLPEILPFAEIAEFISVLPPCNMYLRR